MHKAAVACIVILLIITLSVMLLNSGRESIRRSNVPFVAEAQW